MLAILSSEINLMPDWTIMVQMAVFLSTIAVLHFFIFKPTLKIIDLRKKFTQNAKEEAERLNDEAAALEEQRHNKLVGSLEAAVRERERIINETKLKAEKILANAKTEARGMIDKTEVSVETSEERVSKEMKLNAAEISKDIIKNILGGQEASQTKFK